MKAVISDIKRFAVHDGDGIRTTVFFKGCPLGCIWCHNPECISRKPVLAYYANNCANCMECTKVCPNKCHTADGGVHIFDRTHCAVCGKCQKVCFKNALRIYGTGYTVDAILPILTADRQFYANSGGGVTLSGGECLIYADFCAELLKRLKAENINTAVDTCGFVSKEALKKVIPYTDVFLYDIKSIDENTHIRCTGKSNRIILENLKYIDGIGKKTEIRIPYVPEYNAREKEKILEFIKGLKNTVKVRVLPYHNYAGSKYAALGIKNKLPELLPSDDEIREFQADADKIINFCRRSIFLSQ